jgi:hypothetical protein
MFSTVPLPPQSNIEVLEEQVSFSTQKDRFRTVYRLKNDGISSTIFELAEIQKYTALDLFILENNLEDYLTAASAHIKSFFPNSYVDKELYTDHEESITKLYLTILVPKIAKKQVFKQNRKLFSNWELARDTKFNKFVNITARSI